MNSTIEKLDGHLVFATHTRNDHEAREQLMMLTGQFFNMLEHVARFHSQVITPGYLWDVHEDLHVLAVKHNLPEPSPD